MGNFRFVIKKKTSDNEVSKVVLTKGQDQGTTSLEEHITQSNREIANSRRIRGVKCLRSQSVIASRFLRKNCIRDPFPPV